ncbi:hypothetical protein CC1G_05069 [Coprinopsis cinerea okayama7|uniref:Uncharacterized protein n=1 Tax=Coprinopsis cinerea (strain Okayama-7 / 130 / ATCC MYA-4618 / FGSC 9003) TaxID=240176 RepID=A8NSR4_COPC7|nr:hypothetical protein CC1G_05069 [Coprinopsis cinerea okayama7\|eukprot:XP_001836076.2 hypothetical protein CC1G_05069 [Coprinopsis cinerea okayama7\
MNGFQVSTGPVDNSDIGQGYDSYPNLSLGASTGASHPNGDSDVPDQWTARGPIASGQ